MYPRPSIGGCVEWQDTRLLTERESNCGFESHSASHFGPIAQLRRALASHARGRGLKSLWVHHYGVIAQSEERLHGMQEVARSNRAGSTTHQNHVSSLSSAGRAPLPHSVGPQFKPVSDDHPGRLPEPGLSALFAKEMGAHSATEVVSTIRGADLRSAQARQRRLDFAPGEIVETSTVRQTRASSSAAERSPDTGEVACSTQARRTSFALLAQR